MMNKRLLQLWPTLASLLLVGLVYYPVVGFEFINYDDPVNVSANPFLRPPVLANLLHLWQAPYEKLYIPLTYSMWWLLAQLSQFFPGGEGGGLNPQLYHGANLLLHGVSVLLCQRLLQRLLRSEWGGWAGALLFGLHPLQVEAVAWVTGMKDLLAGFLALLSFYFYLQLEPGAGRSYRLRYGGALLAYGLSMLAKPTGVGLPMALGFTAIVWLQRPRRQVVVELLPWLLLALPIIWITKGGQPAAGGGGTASWLRPLVAGDAVSFYLSKLLCPWQLGADYGRTPAWLAGRGWFYLTGLGPYLLGGILLWKYRRPGLLLPLALFLVPILPVMGLVSFSHQEISTVADRYLYLALVGPALLLGWLGCRWPQRGVRIFLILLVGGWAVKSAVQVRSWAESVVFNRHTLAVNPGSWTAHANLGGALYERGQVRAAEVELVEALRLAPDHAAAHKNLGVLFEEEGRIAEARKAYLRALELRPELVAANYALGLLEAKEGNLVEAERWLRATVELRPWVADYRGNLGVVLYGQQRRAEAAAEFAAALALDPNSAGAHNGLGAVLMAEGKVKEAIDHFQTALQLEPGLEQAAENLRAALAKRQGGR